MSDIVWATIIGGLIGIIASTILIIITHVFEYKKWKKTLQIKKLEKKQENFEVIFEEAQEKLLESMINGNYDVRLVAKMLNKFPPEVLEAFHSFPENQKDDKQTIHQYYLKICRAMQEALSKIDDEIQNIVEQPNQKSPSNILNKFRKR
jgi:F0F1-type ATP synthase gamma subunit